MKKMLSRKPENTTLPNPSVNTSLRIEGQFGRALLPLLFLIFSGLVQAQATGDLNDTGIILCANSESNSIPCSYADSDTLGFPRQDGQMGRSAQAGAAGFSFSTVSSCTLDGVTGLTWERKVTTASNYQLNTNTYNWKNSTSTTNGGIAGITGTASGTTTCFSSTATTCDTESYVAHANTQLLCGYSNWRLPTRLELINIVDASKQYSGSATVDATFFPNIRTARYWTRDNFAANPNSARWVDLGTGADGVSDKSAKYHVILVRP
jgi:hypothetical protein